MTALIAVVLTLIGSTLMLLAAVGVLRMPDLFTRLQASTKASSLGAGCTLLAVAVYYGELSVAVRAVLAISFIFLTVPVSAHLIGRAAYFMGTTLWDRTVIDELEGKYDPDTHALAPRLPPAGDTPEATESRGRPPS
ncbi:MAG: monovalent cation/H(+) antiporter subunit G [Chloroflexi bacterium]|nr:monovalent cation/H(+) antiporter subunit G [Chloroflexota bacterium]